MGDILQCKLCVHIHKAACQINPQQLSISFTINYINLWLPFLNHDIKQYCLWCNCKQLTPQTIIWQRFFALPHILTRKKKHWFLKQVNPFRCGSKSNNSIAEMKDNEIDWTVHFRRHLSKVLFFNWFFLNWSFSHKDYWKRLKTTMCLTPNGAMAILSTGAAAAAVLRFMLTDELTRCKCITNWMSNTTKCIGLWLNANRKTHKQSNFIVHQKVSSLNAETKSIQIDNC